MRATSKRVYSLAKQWLQPRLAPLAASSRRLWLIPRQLCVLMRHIPSGFRLCHPLLMLLLSVNSPMHPTVRLHCAFMYLFGIKNCVQIIHFISNFWSPTGIYNWLVALVNIPNLIQSVRNFNLQGSWVRHFLKHLSCILNTIQDTAWLFHNS